MAHNRKFVPGDVDLIPMRLFHLKHTVFIHDALEKIVIDSGMLENAPFRWIGLIYFFGMENRLKPIFRRISKKHGDLSINIELKAEILEWGDDYNLQFFKDIYMIGGLEALLGVCDKYKKCISAESRAFIQAARDQYGPVPESEAECEAFYGRTNPEKATPYNRSLSAWRQHTTPSEETP